MLQRPALRGGQVGPTQKPLGGGPAFLQRPQTPPTFLLQWEVKGSCSGRSKAREAWCHKLIVSDP